MTQRAAIVRILGVLAVLASASPRAGADDPPVPVFTDVTEKAGIHFKHSFGDKELSNIVEGTGSGAMFFDYDGDGWLDIYLVTGRYRPDVNDNTGRRLKGKLSNRLYRNNHDGTFTDMTEKAGVGGGEGYGVACSAADYDGDGHIDLYVLNYGPNVLYHNNGDGTFTDVSQKVGAGRSGAGAFRASGSTTMATASSTSSWPTISSTTAGKFRNYYAAAGYPGPSQLSRPGRSSLSQQRRRHVHRRDQGGGRLQQGRPRHERHGRRLPEHGPARPLRGQRRDGELLLSQPGQGQVRQRRPALRPGLRRGGPGRLVDGPGLRRRRPRRPARPLHSRHGLRLPACQPAASSSRTRRTRRGWP